MKPILFPAGLAIGESGGKSLRMSSAPQGSFRLFRVAGIDVYLHWMWFLVAYLQIVERPHAYSSQTWNVAEYLVLFGIVLLHEFGHSFATRQVGGTADTILLWPLGGVAYVRPPQRAGAELWSIAAGPLVNVGFLVLMSAAAYTQHLPIFGDTTSDAETLFKNIWWINGILLAFNLLPIYPLDGGQILRSLLWFIVGPVRSLLYATVIGFFGVAGLVALAFWQRSIFGGVIAAYIFMNCRTAFLQARALSKALP